MRNEAIGFANLFVPNINDTDFYKFGIYKGLSFRETLKILNQYDKKPNKIWGFDSFIGLPDDSSEIIENLWDKGLYNSLKNDPDEPTESSNEFKKPKDIIKLLLEQGEKINPLIQTEFIEGYYSDVLTKELVKRKNFKKASYIDIDVDLYSSTLEALTFIIENQLLNDPAVIHFDDWIEYEPIPINMPQDEILHKIKNLEIFTLDVLAQNTTKESEAKKIKQFVIKKKIGESLAFDYILDKYNLKGIILDSSENYMWADSRKQIRWVIGQKIFLITKK